MTNNTPQLEPPGYPKLAFHHIYAIQALGLIGDPRAVELLVECLDRFGETCPFPVVLSLAQLGDHRAKEPLLARLDDTSLGAASAIALIDLLGEQSLAHIIPRLPQWGAHKKLISAVSELGWKPQSEAEWVYVWVVTNNKGELLSNWEQTKRVLLPDLRHEYRARWAANVFLMLKKDDPAVVNGLLSLIQGPRGPISESYARGLLHCRHFQLVNAAANWLERNGHDVAITFTKTRNNFVTEEKSYYKRRTGPDEWLRLLREMHEWK